MTEPKIQLADLPPADLAEPEEDLVQTILDAEKKKKDAQKAILERIDWHKTEIKRLSEVVIRRRGPRKAKEPAAEGGEKVSQGPPKRGAGGAKPRSK